MLVYLFTILTLFPLLNNGVHLFRIIYIYLYWNRKIVTSTEQRISSTLPKEANFLCFTILNYLLMSSENISFSLFVSFRYPFLSFLLVLCVLLHVYLSVMFYLSSIFILSFFFESVCEFLVSCNQTIA
jgi:hypothetical protein